MKIIGFLALVASWGGVGVILSLSLTRRRRELEGFTLGLELLETEMLYVQNPLWLAFTNVGSKVQGNPGRVFAAIGETLKEGDGESSSGAFKKALCTQWERLYINSEDRDILSGLSWDLGVTDLDSQGRRLKNTAAALKARTDQARGVEVKWRRICGMGGWMMGLIFGLLLI